MSATTVIITFEAKPEHANAFAAVLDQVKHQLPRVPGCRGVRVFAAGGAPVFTLVEEWESAAAHGAHIEQVVASGAWNSIAAHLARDPVSHYYSER